jgi:hypothetical protein
MGNRLTQPINEVLRMNTTMSFIEVLDELYAEVRRTVAPGKRLPLIGLLNQMHDMGCYGDEACQRCLELAIARVTGE